MSARFEFAGLAELRAALRELPDELTGEASHIVSAEGEGAAAAVRANYAAHRRSGDLQDGVVVQPVSAGRFGAGVVVKSTAKHAWLFENGSQARHHMSGKSVGAMPPAPPGHAFIPEIIRARRRMWEGLRGVLTRAGLLVSGDGG